MQGWKKWIPAMVVFVGLALLASLTIMFRPPILQNFEYALYDYQMRLAADGRTSGKVVLVDIDDSDLDWLAKELGLPWPWPREIYAHFLDVARSLGARVVVFDLVFEDIRREYQESTLIFADKLGDDTVIGVSSVSTRTRPDARRACWGVLTHLKDRLEDEARLLSYGFRVVKQDGRVGICLADTEDAAQKNLDSILLSLGEGTPVVSEGHLSLLESITMGGAPPEGQTITPRFLTLFLRSAKDRAQLNEMARRLRLGSWSLDGLVVSRASATAEDGSMVPFLLPPEESRLAGLKKLYLLGFLNAEPRLTLREDGKVVPWLAVPRRMAVPFSMAISRLIAPPSLDDEYLKRVFASVPRRVANLKGREITGRSIVLRRVPLTLDGPILRVPMIAGIVPPVPVIALRTRMGSISQTLSGDGIFREYTILSRLPDGRYVPSLALAAYMAHDPERHTITAVSQDALRIGSHTFRLTPSGRILMRFHGDASILRHISFVEFLKAKRLLSKAQRAEKADRPRRLAYLLQGLGISLPGTTDVLTGRPPSREWTQQALGRITSVLGREAVVHPVAAVRRHLMKTIGDLTDTVLVLNVSARGLKDILPSPVDSMHRGGAIQAQMVDALFLGDSLRYTSSPMLLAVLLVLIALVMGVTLLLWSRISSSLVATVVTQVIAWIVVAGVALASYMLHRAGIVIYTLPLLAYPAFGWIGAVLIGIYWERQRRSLYQEAFGRYTSKELVKELDRNPRLLSLDYAEKRELTVFFSDIEGFTSISERLPPDRLVKLITEYLSMATEIIMDEGGTVDKYIGDAVMAFWGAPVRVEDHASRACRAALAISRKLEELNPSWKARFGEEIRVRTGINTGEVIVGNMGSPYKFNYTVMGDTVNAASRLEGINKQYGTAIVVTESTYRSARNEFLFRKLDRIRVKGKEEPITIYQLLGHRDDRSMDALLEKWNLALESYWNREFEKALAIFEILAEEGDAPSRTFAKRCAHFIEHPPPKGWDGVYTFTTK